MTQDCVASVTNRRFVLQNVSCRQSCHFASCRHLLVSPVWPYCQQAQCGRWHSSKWSIADLLTSCHPQMSASHLLGLQVRANGPSSLHCECCTWCHGIMNQNKSIIDHPTCRCNLSKSSIHYKRLMPCPSTGSRMLCASPKIHIHFVPHQKMISVQYLFFCAGTKVFEEALNGIKFLDRHKTFRDM